MVNYKELGLVNTRDMFARAIKGGYAIPAFNFNNLEQLQAIIKASSELKSPVRVSIEEVASSKIITGGSATAALAIESSCRCPCDKPEPSPSRTVS